MHCSHEPGIMNEELNKKYHNDIRRHPPSANRLYQAIGILMSPVMRRPTASHCFVDMHITTAGAIYGYVRNGIRPLTVLGMVKVNEVVLTESQTAF
jgi:hypothetical protein